MTGEESAQERAGEDPQSASTGSPDKAAALTARLPQGGRDEAEAPGASDEPQEGADRPRTAKRPRSRAGRWARRVTLIVLLLALVLGGAGVLGERYASSRLDGIVHGAVPGLSDDAVISTEGLILPQVMAGRLEVLDVQASSLLMERQTSGGGLGEVSSVELLDVEASLRGVGLASPYTTERIEVVASLGFDELDSMVAASCPDMPEMTISAQTYGSSTQAGALEAETSVLGMDATLILEPSVTEDGSLLLTISAATIQGVPVDLDAELAGRTPLSLLGLDSSEITIGPEALPQGLSLTGAHVARDGLRLAMGGTRVDLASL
ncbi:MAG: LmeA family phospholipid-binding protein [Actinomyces sp.]|uniref:LmeA family phospholipid-binding protein n=1 Tax=Actinomyces sp. TaxID=29317 RepID=UPI0026DB71A9|nr:LmeA family phospholipid-binding protein [Actinomyces sp.]MDO4243953.1 LmeA family phospholipid-binding protein [Actinomyces sp.]